MSFCVLLLMVLQGPGEVFAAEGSPKSDPSSPLSKDYSIAQIQGLLKKVSGVLAQCEGRKVKGGNTTQNKARAGLISATSFKRSALVMKTGGKSRPKVCAQKKMLLAMRSILVAYLNEKRRNELYANRLQVLDAENMTLRHLLQSGREVASVEEPKTCYKAYLLKQLMIENGISANGGLQFSKMPLGPESHCWTNSKIKKEASVTLCDYPLAINIQTKGGTARLPTIRKKEYIFSLNRCDLITVRSADSGPEGSSETYVNYDQCIKQWNKRTADAAMTSTQVRLMEDTIGYCFRERLLPPRAVPPPRAPASP